MAEETRQYIFNEGQIRAMFIGSGVLSVSVLVGLLLLMSARPQGRLVTPDRTVFIDTITEATEDLETFGLLEDGRAQISIERAMELVVERGVTSTFTDLEATTQEGDQAGEAGDQTDRAGEGAEPAADGAAVYNTCIGCHQATGGGIPGAFPPLAGHMPNLYNAASDDLDGRSYLIRVMLYGLQGAIEVDGNAYNGLMPAWPQLSDAEIAAVLNHELTSWGNADLVEDFEPYSAADVAAQRDLGLSMQDVYQQRQELGLP